MQHRWFVLVSLIVFASVAQAAAPTLVVDGDDGQVALALTAASIRVTIRGHLARTEHELTYRNSLDRETGGEFTFPLPPDAEVSDVGLWFDGVLRHGVVIERALGRMAYEETVHAGVDPALAEWNAGRAFRLSVYPIPPHGEKKVFIVYDQELTNDDYVLDVSYRNLVPRFDVSVDAEGAVAVEKDGLLRVSRDLRPTALEARSEADGLWYASAAVDLTPDEREMPPAPHTVILYDTSSSSVKQDAQRIRRFLSGFLARQQAWSTAEVIPFHVDVDAAKRIDNAGTPGGARALERVLDDLQPFGATNLLALATRLPSVVSALPPSTRIVLVTDGLTSLGDSRNVAAAFARLATLERRLLVVHAAESVNDLLLSTAAQATGGWAIDLRRTDIDSAIETAMHVPVTARFRGNETVPSAIAASTRTRVIVSGRSQQMLTTLENLPVRVLHSDAEASMVRRAWARGRLREMLATGASDDDVIAHGRTFHQLTPRTSLIVLDSWWDYERYDLPLPPDVLAAKCREEFEREAASVPLPVNLPPANITHEAWSIRGHVLDESGLPLPGVTVVLLDGTQPISRAFTDADGRYEVGAAAAPSFPSIVAHLVGFEADSRLLSTSTPPGTTVDLNLTLTAVTEAITVTAEAPTIDVMAVSTSALRTVPPTTDDLLGRIASTDSGFAAEEQNPEVRAAVARKRRELTRAVIERLRGISSTSERVRYYLSARALLGGDKGFHLLAAEAFREQSPEIAARVLSDLAEARMEEAPVLRIIARVLAGWGDESLARLLLARAIEISPAEPQSWREMILLEAKSGQPAGVASWSRRLEAGKKREWMAAVYDQTRDALARWQNASFFDRQGGVDVRTDRDDDLTIELMWDTGWCFVDIHVVEPSGEIVKWDHDHSASGATFTGGYTFGYGPEIYTLHRAPRGTYHVRLDYYSDDETRVSLESVVHVIVTRRGHRRDYFAVLTDQAQNFELVAIDM